MGDSSYSLLSVDYQPDFSGYSLVPVEHDPFGTDSPTQPPPIQLAQAQPQPASPRAQPTRTQPAPLQPETPPQPPATGVGQPNVGTPANDAGSGGPPSGAANPTLDQGGSSALALFPGYADPAPMGYDQPKIDDQVDAKAGGSGDRRQKIADLASGQIGSGAWDFDVAKGNFAAARTNAICSYTIF